MTGKLLDLPVALIDDGTNVRTKADADLRKTIPAIVEAPPRDLPLRQLIENQQRRAVDPLDVARTLRTYIDEHPGMPQRDLAKILGRSSHWVSTRLILLEMDPELQRKVSAGEMRGDQAYHAHKATTVQEGRGRPRVLRPTTGGSAKVVVELASPSAPATYQATIEVDRSHGSVELLLEDAHGYGVMVTLSPAATRLLGLRLSQAYQAVETVKVA